MGDGYTGSGTILDEGQSISGYVYEQGIKNMLIKQLPREILKVEYPK